MVVPDVYTNTLLMLAVYDIEEPATQLNVYWNSKVGYNDKILHRKGMCFSQQK